MRRRPARTILLMTASRHQPPGSLRPARRLLTASVLALATVLLGSCGVASKVTHKIPTLFGGRAVMRVTVSEQLNDSSPVPVDLLVVYDKEVLAMLGKLTAQDWFRGGMRKQFFKDHPEHAAKAFHWEWVPGQAVPEQRLSYRPGVKGGVIFADYFFPGAHRVEVDVGKPFLLHLAETDLSVEPLR